MKRKPWTIEGMDIVDKDSGKTLAKLCMTMDSKIVITSDPLVRVTTHNDQGQRVSYFLCRPLKRTSKETINPFYSVGS
jgi:hypothetical protein